MRFFHRFIAGFIGGVSSAVGFGIVHSSMSRSEMHLKLIRTFFNVPSISGTCACLDSSGIRGGDVQPRIMSKVSCLGSSLGDFGTSKSVELSSRNNLLIVAGSYLILSTITSVVSCEVSTFDDSSFTEVPDYWFSSLPAALAPGNVLKCS